MRCFFFTWIWIEIIFEFTPDFLHCIFLKFKINELKGEDSVVECTDENGRVEIHMSWNNGKTNSRIATPSGTLSILNRSIVNGALYCKFTRDRTTLVQGREFDLANRAYCLLLASGTSLKCKYNQTSPSILVYNRHTYIYIYVTSINYSKVSSQV